MLPETQASIPSVAPIMAEVPVNHLSRELIASGGNRCMNRKDMTGLRHLERFVKGQIVFIFEFPGIIMFHWSLALKVH